MDSLTSEYGEGGPTVGTGPGQREAPVTFVFMTGHANANANTGPMNPKSQADLINAHCNAHGYFCLDYYSIDSHDMNDNYWEDVGDDGNSAAYGGNFYIDWQDSHVLGEDYFENRSSPDGEVRFGSHNTQHITANRKAYAMWWILARLAGWNGNQTVPVSEISLEPDGGLYQVKSGETLQIHASVLPSDATNPEVEFSVVNVEGEATINSQGLLSATSSGTIKVLGVASDGFGAKDTIAINVYDELVLVSSIQLSTSSGETTITDPGGTLQLLAGILPETASNKQLMWSVEPLDGNASINQEGMLTATSNGQILVKVTATDGSGITDSISISITGQETVSHHNLYATELVYPNPGNGLFFIRTDKIELSRISIYSPVGSLIRTLRISRQEQIIVDLTDQPPGMYLLCLYSDGLRFDKKVIILP